MDTVVRLHRSLVDAIRRERPDRLGQPVTVAQIYQELVPYRSVRAAIGVELIADYEHALLRLLAGEGEFVRIEPKEVREALRRELQSANPDVTTFRDYAACDVWVVVPPSVIPEEAQESGAAAEAESDDASWAPEWVEAAAEALYARESQAAAATEPWDDAGPDAPGPGTAAGDDSPADSAAEWEPDLPAEPAPRVKPSARAPEPPSGSRVPEREPVATPKASAPSASGPEGDAVERELPTPPPAQPPLRACAFCGEDLPSGRHVRFCPFCGEDQSRRPCAACGEVIDAGWRFCIGCGTPAPEPAPSA